MISEGLFHVVAQAHGRADVDVRYEFG